MEVKISSLTEKLLPSGLREMANTYESIRNKMDKTQMNYDDIEKVAVKAGVPPTGLGSVEIKKGLWSYIGGGFFIRVFPENYTTTNLEIYRPGHFLVKKDDKGRIISYSRGPQTVTIEYDDEPGADIAVNTGHPTIPVWRIRRFAYANSEKNISEEVLNKGWLLRGSQDDLDHTFAAAASTSSTVAVVNAHGHGPFIETNSFAADQTDQTKQPINWSDLYARYKDAKSKYNDAKEAVDWAKRLDEAGKLKDYDEYLNEKAAQERIDKGLKAALNPTDFKKKADWIYDLLKMDRDLMYWIDCQLAGTCSDNNDPANPNLPTKVGQPGDSGAQRLGLSPVKKLPVYKP